MGLHLIALAGDGVGPEVTRQALRVIDWFNRHRGLDCGVREAPFGLACFERHGVLLEESVLAEIMQADAVLFGAMGGPGYEKIPGEVRRAGGLLRLRRDMEVFANLRPVRAEDSLADVSPFRPEAIRGVDLVVVRELTGGVYFGKPRGIETLPDGSQRGTDTQVYTSGEIERIARAGFQLARARGGRLTSVDKSNVMESGLLWQQVVTRIGAAEYPDVPLAHMLADNCAMQLVLDPRQFDVLVTDNLFGDLLSDCAAGILGSLGMAPSASLGPVLPDGRRRALYEPVHGSAPDIAGRGIANPLGAILSVAMALRHTAGRESDASLLESAVSEALRSGRRTADICPRGGSPVGTEAMGDAVLAALDSLAR